MPPVLCLPPFVRVAADVRFRLAVVFPLLVAGLLPRAVAFDFAEDLLAVVFADSGLRGLTAESATPLLRLRRPDTDCLRAATFFRLGGVLSLISAALARLRPSVVLGPAVFRSVRF